MTTHKIHQELNGWLIYRAVTVSGSIKDKYYYARYAGSASLTRTFNTLKAIRAYIRKNP